MEEIEKSLLKDERILWKYSAIRNIIKIPLLEILIGLVLTTVFSIIFNALFFILFQETLILIISLVLFPIVSFIIFGITLINPGIKKCLEITNNLKINISNIIRYKEISAITNKRIIQKSYNVFEIDFHKNPITDYKDLEINRDLVFVNLTRIQVVSTEELEGSYEVAFKFSKNDEYYLPILFKIPANRFPEFISILKEEIPLTTKKRMGNFIINYYQS